jgi:hypothetical protein
MSRNNADRLGLDENTPDDGGAAAATAAVEGGSQGLSFSMPTEHVELPSGGAFYPERHPLHNQETIEIKYMTAKEEDILTSPSLIKKGLTVERLLRSVIIDKTIDPQHLLVGDRNAIIIASRLTGYGPEYKAQTTCPMCLTQASWEVNLADLKVSSGGVDCSDGYNVKVGKNVGEYDITVPKTNIIVTVRLLTGRDEFAISERTRKRKKHTQEETNLVTQMKSMIVAVNGSRKDSDVEKLIEFLPAFDSRYIRNAYAKINPNLDMKYPFECQSCDHEDTMEVPLTAEFFWPKGGAR